MGKKPGSSWRQLISSSCLWKPCQFGWCVLSPLLGTPFPTLLPGSAPKSRLFCQPRKGAKVGLCLMEQLDSPPQTSSGLGCLILWGTAPKPSSEPWVSAGSAQQRLLPTRAGLAWGCLGCRSHSEVAVSPQSIPGAAPSQSCFISYEALPDHPNTSQRIPQQNKLLITKKSGKAKPQQTPHQLKQTAVVSFPISLMPVHRKHPVNLASQGHFREESPSRKRRKLSNLA